MTRLKVCYLWEVSDKYCDLGIEVRLMALQRIEIILHTSVEAGMSVVRVC